MKRRRSPNRPATKKDAGKQIRDSRLAQMIGQYHLLKRDYSEAWRSYERAHADDPTTEQAATAIDYFNRLRSPRELCVFEYVCLRHLGREAAANARLADFRRRFPPIRRRSAIPLRQRPCRQGRWHPRRSRLRPILGLFQPGGLTASLVQDFYVAEVCFSVDAAEDAERVFRQRLEADESRSARLSAAIVLAQLLLLQKRHEEFVDLATDIVLPLVREAWQPRSQAASWPSFDTQEVLVLVSGSTLLPVASNEFLNAIEASRVTRLADSLETLRSPASDDIWLAAMDAGLAAAHRRLGNSEAATTAVARL